MTIAVKFDAVSRHFGSVRAVDAVDLEIAEGGWSIAVAKRSKGVKRCGKHNEEAKKIDCYRVIACPDPESRLSVCALQNFKKSVTKRDQSDENNCENCKPGKSKHKITDAHSTNLVKVASRAFNEPKSCKKNEDASAPLNSAFASFSPSPRNKLASNNPCANSHPGTKSCQNSLPPSHGKMLQRKSTKNDILCLFSETQQLHRVKFALGQYLYLLNHDKCAVGTLLAYLFCIAPNLCKGDIR